MDKWHKWRDGEMSTLLYDGTCRFCVAQARRLKRLSGPGMRAESAYAEGVRERFPMLPQPGPDGKMGEIKFVSNAGQIFGGAEAIARALMTGRGPLAWAACLYFVPGVRHLSDIGYAAIARRRYRLSGVCEDCSL
jgi:predicted DCC family thiol-disulfide oxidoreductase YuxK